MYIGCGQLVPDRLVQELAKLPLGERKHSWVQNPKATVPERIEVKKQFLVVTGQDNVIGFMVACWEVRLPLGNKAVTGMEKWKYYFFPDFNEAIEVFAWDEVPSDCR